MKKDILLSLVFFLSLGLLVVPVLGHSGPWDANPDGTTRQNEQYAGNYASLSAAVTAIGSTPTALLIDATLPYGASTTVPATLTLLFRGAGAIDCNNTAGAVTLLKPPLAGAQQIFVNCPAGAVTVHGNVLGQWWGAVGLSTTDGAPSLVTTADAATALQSAMDAGNLDLIGLSYNISTTLQLKRNNQQVISTGKRGLLVQTTDGEGCFKNGSSPTRRFDLVLRDITCQKVNTGITTGIGFDLKDIADSSFTKIKTFVDSGPDKGFLIGLKTWATNPGDAVRNRFYDVFFRTGSDVNAIAIDLISCNSCQFYGGTSRADSGTATKASGTTSGLLISGLIHEGSSAQCIDLLNGVTGATLMQNRCEGVTNGIRLQSGADRNVLIANVFASSVANKIQDDNTVSHNQLIEPDALALGTFQVNGATFVGVLTSSVTAVGNDANASEKTLWSYTVPAGWLNGVGRILRVTAHGKFAANANGKTAAIYFGAASLTTTSVTTNNGNWTLMMWVYTTGTNTQIIPLYAEYGVSDASVTTRRGRKRDGLENTSSSILIKVTGTSAASSANDVVFEAGMIELLK